MRKKKIVEDVHIVWCEDYEGNKGYFVEDNEYDISYLTDTIYNATRYYDIEQTKKDIEESKDIFKECKIYRLKTELVNY